MSPVAALKCWTALKLENALQSQILLQAEASPLVLHLLIEKSGMIADSAQFVIFVSAVMFVYTLSQPANVYVY